MHARELEGDTMTGKVFEDSADIYEDQAQVLFDYYRQAAEKIVSEEQAIEEQVAATEQERQQAVATGDAAHKQLIWCAAGAVASLLLYFVHPALILAGVLVCGILAFQQYRAENAAQASIQQIDQRLAELGYAKENVRRDYRIERMGVAYVPVARRVKSGDRSYVVDYTGDVPSTEFRLTLVNQPEELRSTMDDLQEHLEQMPVVESNTEVELVDTSDYSTSLQDVTLHDYLGTIDREVRSVRYLVGDSRSVSVELPVVAPSSERYRMLQEYGTSDPTGHPMIPVFDARDVQRKVNDFSAMGTLSQQSSEDGSGDVDFFMEVMRQLAQSVDLLSRSRTASMSALIEYNSHIMQCVLKAAFDQYSPTLEAAEIERIRTATFNYSDEVSDYVPFALKESSRVRYDVFADAWVADNGSRTATPFGMHQVDAEVLMPVIDNLMQENRTERLRIYSDIQNQKTDYLNQWHRDTDDFFGRNRSEANELIQRMNEAYAEFVESRINYEQQSHAFEAMKATGNMSDAEVEEAHNQAEVIAGFQLQTNQARAKQDEFTSFMERVREDIDQSAEAFGHVEYYEASLRDTQARENARAAANLRNLDARRLRLATVSAYLAQNGDVPPEPTVSEQLDEDFRINLSSQAENEIRALRGEGVRE